MKRVYRDRTIGMNEGLLILQGSSCSRARDVRIAYDQQQNVLTLTRSPFHVLSFIWQTIEHP